MKGNIHAKRPTRSPRARLFALAALVSGILVAGCGGGAGPNVASVASTSSTTSSAASTPQSGAATSSRSSTTSANGAGSSGPPSRAALGADELAFSKCMRANGVANYPDPHAGGGIGFQGAGIDPSSPAFKAAQTKCNKLVPGIGGGPGSGPPPSAQAVAAMLKVAECMRGHGVPDFPEPRTTLPSDPLAAMGGNGVISDIDGVILLFPSTIDEQSPLFTRAAATCKFALHNH
jgi:hypothetical protein